MPERARLRRSGKDVIEEAENANLLMPGTEDIVDVRVPAWGEIIIGWLRPTLLFALLTAALLFILYVGSAATNIFFTTVGNQSLVVARGTFVGNVAPLNSRVLVSTSTPDSANFLNNIKVGFFGAPDQSVMKIRSGLYDRISLSNGNLLVNDKNIGPAGSVVITGNGSAKLSRQYVVECVSGSCGKRGNFLLIDQQKIYGEVKRG